jgi:hypothetical protein
MPIKKSYYTVEGEIQSVVYEMASGDLFGVGTYIGGEYCNIKSFVGLCCVASADLKARR